MHTLLLDDTEAGRHEFHNIADYDPGKSNTMIVVRLEAAEVELWSAISENGQVAAGRAVDDIQRYYKLTEQPIQEILVYICGFRKSIKNERTDKISMIPPIAG